MLTPIRPIWKDDLMDTGYRWLRVMLVRQSVDEWRYERMETTTHNHFVLKAETRRYSSMTNQVNRAC